MYTIKVYFMLCVSGRAVCSALLTVAPPLPSQPPPGPVVRPARTIALDLPDTMVAAAAPPMAYGPGMQAYGPGMMIPGGIYEREM